MFTSLFHSHCTSLFFHYLSSRLPSSPLSSASLPFGPFPLQPDLLLDKLCFRRCPSTIFTEKPKFILTCRTLPDLTTICLSRLSSLCLSHSILLAILQTHSSESAFLISFLLFLSLFLTHRFSQHCQNFAHHSKPTCNCPYTARLPHFPLSLVPSLLSCAFGIAAQLAWLREGIKLPDFVLETSLGCRAATTVANFSVCTSAPAFRQGSHLVRLLPEPLKSGASIK